MKVRKRVLKNNIIIESLKQEKRIILNISNTALQ
jgi:hypothetical protein